MNRICIAGIGGIGGYMGYRFGTGWLREAPDRELSFLARGEHLKTIQEKGLTFISPSGEKTVVRPTHATEDPATLSIQDLLVLCVKGYHLEEVCRQIQPIIGNRTLILPLLNGIDIYERIRAVLNRGIVLPACIYISSTREAPGVVHQTGGKGNVIAGLDPNYPSYAPAPLIQAMQEAQVPFEWQPDPYPALWNKYIFIASFGLVTGMSGKSIGAVLEDPTLVERLKHIIEEIAALAKAKGVTFSPTITADVLSRGSSFPYATKTSYQRDLEVPGKPNEGDLFGGTIIRMGKNLGIPTPWTEETVKRIERLN
ncbi:MAG: 2-dehydropantoate 2-reductase [Spirochaetes bacterium]|nr:2-dehydropantoate 2-reductase [Spirochaetota bacterium]